MMSLPSRVPRLMPRMASIVLAVAIALPATGALALPTVVNEFNSLYVGVDGVGAASVSGTATYDFVGIGVRSTDPQLTGHAPFAGNPVGTLDVGVGATLNLNYLPGTIGAPVFRPLDNSVVVGSSLGTTGTLNVSGGVVSAPMLFVGQADGLRPSTGTVNITAGGQFNATLDSSATGPLPGFPAISIGRGLGSVGTINVSGAGSRLDASVGMMSLAREGNGTLNVQAGGVVAVGNTVFLSTISSAGSATVRVDGPGSMLDAGSHDILVGIANSKTNDPNHGTAVLDVRNGGEVKGTVYVGSGGTLTGNGLITGNVTNLGGTVKPGNSPGTLHVAGDYSQDGGLIVIEIAGPSAFDILDVTGAVMLDNVLIRFVFTGGFGPSAGAAFDFLKGASLSLDDVSYEVEGLMAGFSYGVSDLNGVLSLTARTDGSPIPEPYTLLLAGVGLLALLMRRLS